METNPQLIDLKTDVPLCYTRGPHESPFFYTRSDSVQSPLWTAATVW